jgi:AcrR family transcriptional regulator
MKQKPDSAAPPAAARPAAARPATAQPRAADRIRQTARDLFYREGIRAVGVDEIVTRAGVTKPSLYRSFPSKDELAAAYLRDYEQEFWQHFYAAMDKTGSDDPRTRLLAYFERQAKRAAADGHYRGCGLSNATVEYPHAGHPAREVAEAHKRDLRRRLAEMAAAMGARDPAALGDALLLLMEGCFITSQQFGKGGPARMAAQAAAALIDAAVAPKARPKTKKA